VQAWQAGVAQAQNGRRRLMARCWATG